MLNKLQFNNLVISNKKGIQQARIQTINKLVHKIRKLKTLLEKHPDNTKCKERVRKSTETIEFLKKIKRVDIMKQTLLMDKAPAAIITNGLSTPDEIGVALLAMNKVMMVLIKRFKTELKLDDKESNNWKEELTELSKRRQKIERTEQKRRKRIETKEQKAVGRKRQEWIEKNNPGAEEEQTNDDADTNESTVGKWKVEEMEIEEKEVTIKKSDKKMVSDLKRSQREKPSIKKKEFIHKKLKENITKTELIETETQFSKDNPEEVIAANKFNDSVTTGNSGTEENIDSQHFSDDNHVQTENPEDCDESESEETMVVDPFFITDTGENYLSTAVIKRGQNVATENSEDKRGLHMIKLNSAKNPSDFRDRRQQSRDSNQLNYRDRNNQPKERFSSYNGEQKYQPNKRSNQNDRNEKFQQNNWKNNKDRDYKMASRDKELNNHRGHNNNSSSKEEQNLHPSWAAKQKLKPVITSFQGKKITFGDDDNNIKTSNTYNQPQNKVSKNLTPKPTNSDKDSLHPSWIAKQKLKPTITAFQGKKITFDN